MRSASLSDQTVAYSRITAVNSKFGFRSPPDRSSYNHRMSKRLLILTVGSQGDVQPYVALGQVQLAGIR